MQINSEQLCELLLPTLTMNSLFHLGGKIKNTNIFNLFQLMLFIDCAICRIYKSFFAKFLSNFNKIQ